MQTTEHTVPSKKPVEPTGDAPEVNKGTISRDTRKALIDDARDVLRGESRSAEELKLLLHRLEAYEQYAYASELLSIKIEQLKKEGTPVALTDYQKLAKYIYKDSSLPSGFKFNRAIRELNANDDLSETSNCETLGLAGAIYKYKWFYDHQFNNLILSHYYYGRGYDTWRRYLVNHKQGDTTDAMQNDDGYTAVNLAYICDLMAVDQLEALGTTTGLSDDVDALLEKAREVRQFILDTYVAEGTQTSDAPQLKTEDSPSWVLATLAECYLGLCRYKAAQYFIMRYKSARPGQEWELRTFNRQVFSIAYLQLFLKRYSGVASKKKLYNFEKLEGYVAGIDRAGVEACIDAFRVTETVGSITPPGHQESLPLQGKPGLALSGGGFRASIFHIGLLAALAEKDVLKDIQVISCVSGGSIIGAYYYLKLKQLLETKHDDEIVQEDYIQLVKEIETEFLNGVRSNLRMRIFSNPLCNIKMLFNRNYSRTHRLGELYEKFLYAGLLKKRDQLSGEYVTVEGPIYMHQLFINPLLKEGEAFSFVNDNWKRKNKIPQLVLNATSVNTGHNWQFTASWMGEPPGNIQTDIDVKPRLRRMYYEDAPQGYKQFRLGYAVAASSCVPVMFEPMPMYDLYPGIDLQLIDGGLHDNQGIAALIEQECMNMIVSDASGQLPTSNVAAGNEAALFYRADNILQERLRELQFMDIKSRSYTAQINKLLIVNLKNGLQTSPRSWKYCKDPERKILYAGQVQNDNQLTAYGVERHVQQLLSEIRTDLDAFHETESFALMYSAYRQTQVMLAKLGWNQCECIQGKWDFLSVEESVTLPEKAATITPLLEASKQLAFKVIEVSKPVRYTVMTIGLLLAVLLVWLGIKYFNSTVADIEVTVRFLFFLLLIVIAGTLSKWLSRILDYKATIRKYIIFIVLSVAGCIASNVYLALFNRIYLDAGKCAEKK